MQQVSLLSPTFATGDRMNSMVVVRRYPSKKQKCLSASAFSPSKPLSYHMLLKLHTQTHAQTFIYTYKVRQTNSYLHTLKEAYYRHFPLFFTPHRSNGQWHAAVSSQGELRQWFQGDLLLYYGAVTGPSQGHREWEKHRGYRTPSLAWVQCTPRKNYPCALPAPSL